MCVANADDLRSTRIAWDHRPCSDCWNRCSPLIGSLPIYMSSLLL